MHPCPAHKCRGVDGNAILIADGDAMCAYHVDKVRQAITEAPKLYLALDDYKTVIPRQPAVDDVRVSTSGEAPVPIDVHARSLQEDLLAVTRRAEVAWRRAHDRRHGDRPLIDGGARSTIRRRAAFLAPRVGEVLALDVAVGLDVLTIKHHVRQMFGLTRTADKAPFPCPECDSMALWRDNGSSWIACRKCNLRFPEDRYGLLVRIYLDANREATP